MSQIRTWLSSLSRQRKVEVVAVLLAGLGIGVGAGALLFSSAGRDHSSPKTVSRRAAESTSTIAPASAGTQPGRATTPSTGAIPQPTSRSILRAGSAASFNRLNASHDGDVELAISPLGEGSPRVLGADAAAHGWSTTKVPVLAALLKARGDRGLSEQETAWAHSAITESSNESVLELFNDLEHIEGGLLDASTYMQELLSESGDEETQVATASPPPNAVTTFGQTLWRPSQAVKFFSALARNCLLAGTQTRYVLELMENIEPAESWGLGSAGFSSVAFKGGWGPEPNEPYAYLVRQSGIVDVGTDRAVAVALVDFAPSFEAGTATLTETARWLHDHLRLVPRPKVGCTHS